METIKERADRIAKKRLETIQTFDRPDKPEIRTNWLLDLLEGRSTAGKITGITLDVLISLLPQRLQRTVGIIRKRTKEEIMPARIKPFLKQKSTYEGIAAIAGALGIAFYPEAAMQIVAGVLTAIGGIELWKKEAE